MIAELQNFATPETVIMCVSKNPLELMENRPDFDQKKLKKMNRIALILQNGEATVEAEGLSGNIFEAIREAKEKLFAMLSEIQNEVLSSQERQVQIESARNPTFLH